MTVKGKSAVLPYRITLCLLQDRKFHGLQNWDKRFTCQGWGAGVFMPLLFFPLLSLQENVCVRISTHFPVPTGRTPGGNWDEPLRITAA